MLMWRAVAGQKSSVHHHSQLYSQQLSTQHVTGLLKEGIASGHDLLHAQQRAERRPRGEQRGRSNSFLSPTQHSGPKELFGRLGATQA